MENAHVVARDKNSLTPRPDQFQAHNAIIDALDAGVRCPLAIEPMAWGKSVLLAMLASTLARPHAANSGPCEAMVIAWKLKVRRRLRRMIIRAQSEVLIDPIGVHDFSRIHFSVRIPDAFKLPKGLHQRGREHARQ